MSFADTARIAEAPRCATFAIAGDCDDEDLKRLLEVCLSDPDIRGPIDVFARRRTDADGDAISRIAARDAGRLRWHPRASGLREALNSLRTGFDSGEDLDIAWVCAGLLPPPGWRTRLRRTLGADDRVGVACPLDRRDPDYSPFDPGSTVEIERHWLDEWLRVNGSDLPVEQPKPLPGCGLIRAGAWRAILADRDASQPAGEDWGLAVSRAGYVHAACTTLAVFNPAPTTGFATRPAADPVRCEKRPRSGTVANPGDGRQLTLLASRELRGSAHPLAHLRWQLRQELARRASGRHDSSDDPSGAPIPPRAAVRLHVAHSWGGGLGSWVRDFCEADASNQHLVLRSIGVPGAYGQRLALYLGTESTEPVRFWELALPIHATALTHLQYRAILREIVDEFGIDGVLVSSLIGHSLDALRSGLPTVVVTHDHHPFCIALFAYFDGECRQCDRGRLSSCIERNPGHRFFRGAIADDWMALRGAFCDAVLKHDLSLVAPSESVMQRWRALMPSLDGARWKVVAHGVLLPTAVAFTPPANGKLRLIILGRLSPEKGSDLLEELFPEIAEFAELTVLGCGDEAARIGRRRGVTAIASYSRDELPRLIAQARPHLGLQLSIVPETFGYTLSELWHCGVPVLACRVGSLADRVREGENGALVEPDATAIAGRLREFATQRDLLAKMSARLRSEAQPSCATMVARYAPLLPALVGRAESDSQRRTRLSDHGRLETHAPQAMTSGRIALGPLSVDPQVTYLQAARAFVRFTLYKAMHSPRVPVLLRRLIAGRRG